MGADDAELAGVGRSQAWRWLVCSLLLLGTVVNYMDRLTINTLAPEIKTAFTLNNEQYGQLELGFGLAFAAGGVVVGLLVDWIGVYWVFPAVLLGWSIMGFLTGLSRSFEELLLLRIFLGFFEAGHFPCGLKTVQLLLTHRDRALGNGLLQSGTALGAVFAQPVIRLLASDAPDGWRPPFLVIGGVGCLWIVFWFFIVRYRDVPAPKHPPAANPLAKAPTSYWGLVFSAQFLALAVMVVCINMNLHFFRVWLPNFLVEVRKFTSPDKTNFMALFYIAAGFGSLAAGGASSWLANRGLSVFDSRMTVYAGCCVLTLCTTVAPFVSPGLPFLIVLMTVAVGTLGTFAAYYSLTQDLSTRHQGKISGTLSATTWLTTATFHPIFGRFLDSSIENYTFFMVAMGWLPLVGLIVVMLLWKQTPRQPTLAPLPPEDWQSAGDPNTAIRTSEQRITE